MPVFALSAIIQIALVFHIIKTGRNTTWIWIVVIVPLAGSLAYIVMELIPDLLGTRSGRRAARKVQSVINPNGDINNAAFNYSISGTVENSMVLAEECLNQELYEEASELYEKCLSGIYENDPAIMYGLAMCHFGMRDYPKTKQILDDLIKHNPEYKNPDAHLLYAKNVEQLGDIELALSEYEVLSGYYPGPEPAYHYAMLLRQQGRHEPANVLLDKILQTSKVSGRHYNELHSKWVKLAKTARYG